MRLLSKTALFSIFLGLTVLPSCGDSGDGDGDDDGDAGQTLRWSMSGLAPLGDDLVYEGWVIVDGNAISTGRFTVDEDGNPSIDSFEMTADQVAGATRFVLTLEPDPEDDPGPAPTKLLAGDFGETEATLSVDHEAALATDFSDASGSFILQTPTSADVADDHALGIWWLDPAGGGSLDLPALPAGWVYEGWVVGGGGPITTGRFSTADGEDHDGAGPEAGPDGSPPFPGQDFIDPPTDLTGMAAVITVEPEPDDSPAPFVLKPLADLDIEDVGPGVLQEMANDGGASNPTGLAWFE